VCAAAGQLGLHLGAESEPGCWHLAAPASVMGHRGGWCDGMHALGGLSRRWWVVCVHLYVSGLSMTVSTLDSSECAPSWRRHLKVCTGLCACVHRSGYCGFPCSGTPHTYLHAILSGPDTGSVACCAQLRATADTLFLPPLLLHLL
jgi:hypothetical protein